MQLWDAESEVKGLADLVPAVWDKQKKKGEHWCYNKGMYRSERCLLELRGTEVLH